MRALILIILSALILWGAYALLQRLVLAVLLTMILLLSSGCDGGGLQMPPPWECHKAIRYAVYQRHACVIMEAVTSDYAKQIIPGADCVGCADDGPVNSGRTARAGRVNSFRYLRIS